ncbi:RNA-directed DNA polymerase, eukaryota [Tanacetum coccineum]
MGDRRPFNSKEDLTQKISTSVFVTNFLDHCTAHDLWNVCLAYGKVIDVYIPFKKSKAGKKFAFVHFLKVDNLKRLIGNLYTLWIGRFRLQANPVKFQREPRASNSTPKKGNDGVETKSFAFVLKSNHLNSSASKDSMPAIVLDDSCIQENDLSCAALGKIKDINALPNLYAILHNEEKLTKHTGVFSWFSELGHANNLFVSDVRLVWTAIEGLPICAWNKDAIAKIVSPWGTLSDVDTADDDSLPYQKVCVATKVSTIINDRIKIIVKGKIYWIRIRELEAWSPEFDDEFCDTSSVEESVGEEKNGPIQEEDLDHVSESSCMKENNEAEFIKKARTHEVQSEDPFEIYDLFKKKATKEATQDDDPSHPQGFTPKDNAAKEKEEAAYSVNQFSNNGNSLNKATKEATQDDDPSHPPGFTPKDDAAKEKEEAAYSVNQFSNNGNSLNNGVSRVHNIGQTMGYNMEGCKKNLKDIVASHGDSQLWGNFSFDFTLSPSIGFSGGILCVWDPNIFLKDNATISDSFVAVRGTWVSSSTKLMIVSVYAPQDLSEKKSLWEYITHIIDLWDGECIILGDFNEFRSEHERFGSIFNVSSAKAFNHFISASGLIDLPLEWYSYTWSIKSASKMSKLDRFLVSEGLLMLFPSLSALCLERHLSDHRPIIMREGVADYGLSPFRVYHSWFTKDGFDKLVEDSWKTLSFADSSKITILRKKFQALKASIKAWCKDDKQRSINERTSLLKELHNINKCHSLDMAQKAKVRWSIEGDENSKFFHGIINMKRSQLAIRGVLIEGDWIDKPYRVKNEFLNHFSNRFARPTGPNIVLDSNMFKHLSSEKIADLECDVTYDEIKRAVWDCGTNKSPGPDGKFPPGSNSLFIALIPKKQDAKLVKDFRSISLIGCFYKIIAKILANRLSMVISDLISDVQSAFVPNRQILDGPFILNELISWCKFHKSKAMIFKVDFEKAFDSVRWDYLDGILSNFGFGSKWREWIHSCLTSAMGSILVNGSLTSEFKFHKGLKQGDPLSPFLFILVMESLHLSFNNILNAGLFKGIRIDDSLTLSHLFYVDDAVFIGYVLRSSPWNCIIRELSSLSSQGINLLAHLKKKVGNDVHTSFWEDSWINDIPLSQSYPRLYALENRKHITVAEKISEATLIDTFRRAPRGGVEEDQFIQLVELVDSVILSNSNDRWVWLLDPSGEYSVSSARTYIDDLLLPTVGSPTRCAKVVPIKINIFAWKVCLDKLSPRLNLSLRGIDIPSIVCPNCSLAGESCSHLFFSCSMARLLWRKVARWWDFDIPEFSSYEEWITWFKSIRIPKVVKDVLEGVFYVMWWVIWNFRNQVLFEILGRVWIFSLMKLFYYLSLGVLIDVKIILIVSHG